MEKAWITTSTLTRIQSGIIQMDCIFQTKDSRNSQKWSTEWRKTLSPRRKTQIASQSTGWPWKSGGETERMPWVINKFDIEKLTINRFWIQYRQFFDNWRDSIYQNIQRRGMKASSMNRKDSQNRILRKIRDSWSKKNLIKVGIPQEQVKSVWVALPNPEPKKKPPPENPVRARVNSVPDNFHYDNDPIRQKMMIKKKSESQKYPSVPLSRWTESTMPSFQKKAFREI